MSRHEDAPIMEYQMTYLVLRQICIILYIPYLNAALTFNSIITSLYKLQMLLYSTRLGTL